MQDRASAPWGKRGGGGRGGGALHRGPPHSPARQLARDALLKRLVEAVLVAPGLCTRGKHCGSELLPLGRSTGSGRHASPGEGGWKRCTAARERTMAGGTSLQRRWASIRLSNTVQWATPGLATRPGSASLCANGYVSLGEGSKRGAGARPNHVLHLQRPRPRAEQLGDDGLVLHRVQRARRVDHAPAHLEVGKRAKGEACPCCTPRPWGAEAANRDARPAAPRP